MTVKKKDPAGCSRKNTVKTEERRMEEKTRTPVGNGGGKQRRSAAKEKSVPENKKRTSGREGRRCPVASKCGGCRWIEKEYKEQLSASRKL